MRTTLVSSAATVPSLRGWALRQPFHLDRSIPDADALVPHLTEYTAEPRGERR